ncbi:MAG: ribonuclease E/G, partial [Alphaproteobacteria bacterium]|nr:ribonuclease E/G [Alphaproteobacteria bacterium]
QMPLFSRYQVESYLGAMFNPTVQLKSGGYIVIGVTEALVAIDVNSGRATRERHIEETALKTNLEAADEIARQLRLRDLAGLIVIDFIDMEDSRNNQAVERRLKDALRTDRARIQVGRISHFGLLEMSRQRLRPSLAEMSSELCQYCSGTGYIRSVEWTGLHLLRAIEEEALKGRAGELVISVPTDSALYLLNHKRAKLHELEQRHEVKIQVLADGSLVPPAYTIDLGGVRTRDSARDGEESGERPSRRKRRSRRRRRSDEAAAAETDVQETLDADSEAQTDDAETPPSPEDGEGTGRRRKRGRRGGRRRNRRTKGADDTQTDAPAEDGGASAPESAAADDAPMAEEAEAAGDAVDVTPVPDAAAEASTAEDAATDTAAEPAKPRRARRTRRRAKGNGSAAKSDAKSEEETPDESDAKPARKRQTRKAGATTKRRKGKTPDEASDEPSNPGPCAAEAAPDAGEPQQELPPTAPSAPADNPAMPSEEPQEKRTGWWNRVVG